MRRRGRFEGDREGVGRYLTANVREETRASAGVEGQ
jgi:hypothetical protein